MLTEIPISERALYKVIKDLGSTASPHCRRLIFAPRDVERIKRAYTMPLKLFPPGTRKRNRWYIANCRIVGKQYEFVARDTESRPTANAQAAKAFIKRITETTLAEAERERREHVSGAPHRFGGTI